MAEPKQESKQEPKLEKMNEDQIEVALKDLPEWSHVGESLQCTFGFKDFIQSIRFVNAVADEAERTQHHPDMLIRYNRVTLTLSTHDASGITHKDFALAKTADSLAARIAKDE